MSLDVITQTATAADRIRVDPGVTTCPGCAREIPVSQQFVTWCPTCDWNVAPAIARPWTRRQLRATERTDGAARRLFAEISANGPDLARSQTVNLWTAALLLHILTVVTLATGVALCAVGFGITGPVRFVLAGCVIALALYLQPVRPAPRSRRRWAAALTRTAAPVFFALIDDVADALSAQTDDLTVPRVENVYFSTRYTSSLIRRRGTGWTLTIGLAHWSVLTPAERVALIAEQLARPVDGDRRRTRLVASALTTADRWRSVGTPLVGPAAREPAKISTTTAAGTAHRLISAVWLSSEADLIRIVGAVAVAPFTLTAAAASRWLQIAARRQGHAAEYHADRLAAQVAGTDAVRSVLETASLRRMCQRELDQAARLRPLLSPWEELGRYVHAIPELERERQRRAARRRLTAADPTQPPTQLRADLIATRLHGEPAVVLHGDRLQAITRELAGVHLDATVVLRTALLRTAPLRTAPLRIAPPDRPPLS